jgi:UDP-N-acetylmuramate: L-alanyl-gamma-D-glutamyl-meso-diaminopimelate ligase
MLAFILDAAGRAPGFLVGGVPENFGVSARLGSGNDFVIEADEYDTAFFDKRSKFVHYRPHICILNNLEFDHADIFPDVAAIQRQFHHLVRIVPGNGRLIVNAEDPRLAEVLAMGAWTPVTTFGIERGDWRARLVAADGSAFVVTREDRELGEVRWNLLGRHNVMNALAALAAADAAGVDTAQAIAHLADFRNAKRRMELIGEHAGIRVYDDFAHHPTAIATTLAGLRARVGKARILVGMEPRSNSMRLGAHADELAPSLGDADGVVFLRKPELAWDAERVTAALAGRGHTAANVDALIAALIGMARPGDHVVFMSNGGFENAPRRFLDLIPDSK